MDLTKGEKEFKGSIIVLDGNKRFII